MMLVTQRRNDEAPEYMYSGANIHHVTRQEILYPKWDSNPHIFRYCILSATRLPIPPFGLGT